MTHPRSASVTKELIAAALRHADGITSQLARPDWKPGRAHIEQARNSIKKLADMLDVAQQSTTDRNLAEGSRCKDCPAPRCAVCPVPSTTGGGEA